MLTMFQKEHEFARNQTVLIPEQRRMQSQPIEREDTPLGMEHKIFFTKPKDDDLGRLFKHNGKHKNLL
jgi:hypothetical protein